MRWIEGKIKEYIALLKLMQPIAKIRLGILVFDGLWLLFIIGFLFNYLSPLYFIISAIVMVLYIVSLLIYTFR